MNYFRIKFLIIAIATVVVSQDAEVSLLSKESTTQDEKTLDSVDYRLPETVYPTLYEIKLIPNFREFTFIGIAKIHVTVKSTTDSVTLHAGDIKILSASVTLGSSKIQIQDVQHDKTTEKYTIKLVSFLFPGSTVTLAFTYTGELNDRMIGFYRSSYVDADGNIKWLAATQFQATHARHAFPCFDEPSFKAAFSISIQRSKQYKCISNMPLQTSQEISSTLYWDIFKTSIPMSTYLVAFVISEFDYLQSSDFKVWARPNALDQADYALKIGPEALAYLSDLFKQEYQLPKMDMVAVPDFAAGAMENWGLITYRETRMLYHENDSSVTALQSVAAVIVHECTHMWFGNLVTPAWWSYLWLSEAFARYYQYFGTAQIETTWNMEDQFLVDQHQSALNVDGLESSRPMTRNVASQSEIGSMGDSITYSKGASIVRMMNLVFGSDVFDRALQNYLEENKEKGIAYPEDLWSAIQNQIEFNGGEAYVPVQTSMDSWTTQAGYPVVSVSINGGKVTLQQQRFLLRNLDDTPTDITWWIPITWTSQNNPDFSKTTAKHWFHERNDEINVNIGPEEWIIFNVQSSGFYRVNYDDNLWYRIIDFLNNDNFEEIHVLNRAAIIDDLLNLARAGLLPYKTALDGLQYIKRETNYLPFSAAFSALEYINRRFAGQEHHPLLTKHILSLIEDVYVSLGYEDREGDDRLTVLLRHKLNQWACNLGHEGCIANAIEKFDKWMLDSSSPIKPNERTVVYCTAIQHGTYEHWKFLWNQYFHSNSASEQSVIIGALGCSRSATTLKEYLGYALTSYEENRIRRQDSLSVFSAVYNSGMFGAEYLLEFIAENHEDIEKYYGNLDSIASILSGASQRYSTQELIDKYERFITMHSFEFKSISKSLHSSLKLAKYELSWYQNNYEDIVSWLQSHNDAKTSTTEPTTTTTEPTVTPTDPIVTPTEPIVTPTDEPVTPTPTDEPVTPTPTDEPVTPTPTEDPGTVTPPPVGEDNTTDTTSYFLPKSIIPKKYVISLEPYIVPGNFTFDGHVRIVAEVNEETKEIVLHSSEIEHRYFKVIVNNKELDIESVDVESKYDFVVITLAEELKIGTEVVIEVRYTGILNREMRGFYRSSYTDDDGETRWLAATHLEPVGARKMFPCFDEPALKATFTLRVKVREHHAISNMPIEDISLPGADGQKWITFDETPKMSTYLVALVVSDFKSMNDTTSAVRLGVWARPNAIYQAEYALSVMRPLLDFYEKSLGHKYQLPKLDMVALPDFTSGAMENWGLLTYREKNMLYTESDSTISAKKAIANVISHEISHQWFGNLVSPLWWKYLWLNEGFARYFQYFGTANVETEWSLESQFVVDHLHSAFSTDGSSSSHAMSHDVYSPTEIRGVFDAISYAKGASVLRMMEKILGREAFYAALHDYLEARQYDVATPEDLYEAFQKHADSLKLKYSIKTIMDSWTTQPGYPVVYVEISGDRAYLSQERFLIRNYKNAPVDSTWYVPITWTSLTERNFVDTTPQYWLKDKTAKIKIDRNENYIFNLQQSGFYRVNYDTSQWIRIAQFLKSSKFNTIHELNRASLLDDLMNLARAGYTDYAVLLHTTLYLKQEIDYIPWRAFFNGLTYLHQRFLGRDTYDLFKKHLIAIMIPVYERLGFEDRPGDSHTDQLLRHYLRVWACKWDILSCRSRASRYFHDWKANQLPPLVSYRSVAYCSAMIDGTSEDWLFLWKQYLSAQVTTDKLVMLEALACTTDTSLLERLLLNAITENSGIRYQDSSSVFSSVYDSGLIGVSYTMDFIRKYYNEMYEYYGDHSQIRSIINGISTRLSTEELFEKYEKLLNFVGAKEPKIVKSLNSYRTRANYELTWYYKYSPRIIEWLLKTYPDESYRLPSMLRPTRYNISLNVFPPSDMFTFHGKVQIDMKVVEKTSRIVLNAHELVIKNISVYRKIDDGDADQIRSFEISSTNLDSKTQKLTIFLTSYVDADEITAEIEYTGTLNDEMRGFYRSHYKDVEEKLHWIATTQFEPTHARSAFPCFDEPAYKARFLININRPNNCTTLSNMPIRVSLSGAERSWDHFYESEVMSPYLVAFVVSDFEPIRNTFEKYNIWGRPEVVFHGSYAQIAAVKVVKYFENYTGLDYTLPKMDLIGIPDFSMGAMENWGLLTFREYGLFLEKSTVPARYRKYLITIVAHEIAHMWFGNLVTCAWWDNLWLNEGFAEYFQYLSSDYFREEYRFADQFVVDELHVAMEVDGWESSRAMTTAVSTPSEIMSNFDKIAYAKSASVIRMLHHTFGDKVFKQALNYYLNQLKYNVARPEDLASALDRYVKDYGLLQGTNLTVHTLLHSWTSQAGYPVVYATQNGAIVTLSQERFYLSGRGRTDTPIYWTPITMTTRAYLNFEYTETRLWLGSEPLRIYINPNEDWFIVNVRQVGYYRVNYDQESWTRLIRVLDSSDYKLIHEVNRAQIIDDLFALARADYVDYKLALDASRYLTRETGYLPWKAFLNSFSFLLQRYEGRQYSDILKNYLKVLIYNAYRNVGFGEPFEDELFNELNREQILKFACKLEQDECVIEAMGLFNYWRSGSIVSVPRNAKSAVYCTAMARGTPEDWEFLWDKYLHANLASEKQVILNSLGCTKNATTLYFYLDKILTDGASPKTTTIRKQDVAAAFGAVYNAGEVGVEVAMEFLLTNYYALYKHFGNWDDVGSLFSTLASHISLRTQIEKLEVFIENNKKNIAGIKYVFVNALRTAKNNYQWYEDHAPAINDWLSDLYLARDVPDGSTAIRALSVLSVLLISLIPFLLH